MEYIYSSGPVMNGPTGMYKLKPLVQFIDAVDLPPSMYKMKNIYSSNYLYTPEGRVKDNQQSLPNILEQKPSCEINDLEKRQKTILDQLNYLKNQMLILREELTKKNFNSTSMKQTNSLPIGTEPLRVNVEGEVVVHASPERPPYSLLACGVLWPGLRLHVSCHSHSSLTSLPPHVGVFDSLSVADGTLPSPALYVRLIWRQMGADCELVMSPLAHTPVRGEVNLLRYLHRSLGTSDTAAAETLLDSVLDSCHRLSHARTQRDKQLAVRALNARLGKNECLLGDKLSVADVAAWSVLQAVTGVEQSQNMTKWFARCTAAFGPKAG